MIRFSFKVMSYFGKYRESRKAVDLIILDDGLGMPALYTWSINFTTLCININCNSYNIPSQSYKHLYLNYHSWPWAKSSYQQSGTVSWARLSSDGTNKLSNKLSSTSILTPKAMISPDCSKNLKSHKLKDGAQWWSMGAGLSY